MTKKQLDYLKSIILAKRERILKESDIRKGNGVSASFGDTSENSAYAFHMADQGTDTMEKEQQYMFVTRDENFLYHLSLALERIEKGEYGKCVQCDNEISFERLEAVPHCRLCIKCKSKEEINKR
jgi:RNA polymerase-binding protein DksA